MCVCMCVCVRECMLILDYLVYPNHAGPYRWNRKAGKSHRMTCDEEAGTSSERCHVAGFECGRRGLGAQEHGRQGKAFIPRPSTKKAVLPTPRFSSGEIQVRFLTYATIKIVAINH